MPSFNLFSKRHNPNYNLDNADYILKEFSLKFRNQVIFIIKDALGTSIKDSHTTGSYKYYQMINDALCREYGIQFLNKDSNISPEDSIFKFLREATNYLHVLDVIELSFTQINTYGTTISFLSQVKPKIKPNDAIDELNQRFLENNLGYQFEGNQIIILNSTYEHKGIIQPSLNILKNPIYAGANEEFLKALEQYKNNEHKESLNNCLKTFESVMKSICKNKGWTFPENVTAKGLIDICFTKELIPKYMQSHFTSLRSLLESGIPTIRNKLSGHGQGEKPVVLPKSFVNYALNMTATSISFLSALEKEFK